MSKHPIQQVYVIYSKDAKELKMLAPIAHELEKYFNLLFVRSGQVTNITESMLINDVRSQVFPVSEGHDRLIGPMVMALKGKSLRKELEKRNIEMMGFVGSDPSVVDKKPVLELSDVLYRLARVCKRCECTLYNSESFITKAKAEEIREQYSHDADADVSFTTQYLNINIRDECARGC